MVGTFISKYLLVTTSTITVTSAAAVTFFVAKHLKVGKGYEKAMDYIKQRYIFLSKLSDKNTINQNICSNTMNNIGNLTIDNENKYKFLCNENEELKHLKDFWEKYIDKEK